MSNGPELWVEVDEEGRLICPAGVAGRFGLRPGARARLDEDGDALRLHRPVTHLARLYIEPTNRCNLTCRICPRNDWDVTLGWMSEATFARILDGLKALSPGPTVFFGGLGEPLFHPRTTEMVARVKELGLFVELITNGTLLTPQKSRELIDAGLDVLWVSIDGATPEHYADVRLGAELPRVLENLAAFKAARRPAHRPVPEIGIAFVAMRRNVADLPEVVATGRRLGATRFSVSNLLPTTPELCGEITYGRALNDITYLPSSWVPNLTLPKMDLDELTGQALLRVLRTGCNLTFAGQNLGGANDTCIFVERGSMAIGWDGSASPCLPLLYTHVSYLRGRRRVNRRHVVGNVAERELIDLWSEPGYVAYRERLQRFGFSPCTACGGCEMAESNEEDCLGNPFPACGGCLWAQGVIRCP